jgi:hypothetical protein
LSTPALAQTNPCFVSAMTRSPRRRRHGARLAEDGRDHIVGLLDAPFRLRHRLLRDDEHVTLLEPAGPLDRIAEERSEVVPGLYLREPGERNDADHQRSRCRRR